MKRSLCCVFVLLAVTLGSCQREVIYQDATHLNFLGGTLSNYTTAYQKMPGNINDKQGKPLLSWRVDLLRAGGDRELSLYRLFRLDEPWNSPHNLKVARTVPFMYIDPKGPACKPTSPEQIEPLWSMSPEALNYTPYLAVIGPKTAFDSCNVPEQDSGYAAIVVIDKSDVLWTEPRDVPLQKIKKNDPIRYYGNKSIYLTPRGVQMDFEKSHPPNYEFD